MHSLQFYPLSTLESYKYTLPVEQWSQILAYVSHGDLCNVVLASRYMYSVANLPELWDKMKVSRIKLRENGLAELYNINRFKKVKQINFRDYFRDWKLQSGELERLLKEIPGSPLENLNLSWNDLSRVSAELLASAVSHLHIVNLEKAHLTTDQCVELLKASLSSTTLQNVDLSCVNLSKVPSELLANSISRLQEVNLWGTDLTTNQCVALLKVNLSSTTLRSINLPCVNLSEVPAELLAISISRLQDVVLSITYLTNDQCVALLEASLSSTTLMNVYLGHVNLSGVPSGLLANSISRLQGVNLCNTDITTYQCVTLLKAILSSTTLRNVNLKDVDLSEVPSELLANSINRLQVVELSATYLTNDQCVALLEVSLSSTTLKNVSLGDMNLSEVPAELLASSVSRLQDVNLWGTDLTTNQCVALLKVNLSSTTLRSINLPCVKLSEVPAELLANSFSRLQEVSLWSTDLTTNQCVSLLKSSISSTTLKSIYQQCVHFNKVPAGLDYSRRGALLKPNLSSTTLKYVATFIYVVEHM